MRQILLPFLLTFFLASSLYSAENFSEMSTQELISIMGYVKKPQRKKFRQELKSRVASMNKSERRAYRKNLAKKHK